jgi:hypothetical protein
MARRIATPMAAGSCKKLTVQNTGTKTPAQNY